MDRSSPGVRGRMNSTGSLAPLTDFSPQLANNALLVTDDTRESVRRSVTIENDIVEPSVMTDMEMETAGASRDVPDSPDSDSGEAVSRISCKSQSICSNFD